MAEKAESQPSKEKPKGYNFDETTLVELKKHIHAKRTLLQAHPECPDYQAIYAFEQHIDRRLTEIAWNRYKKEKGLE